MLAKVSDLANLPVTQAWLSADKKCLDALERLKVLPEGIDLRTITTDKMATPGVNWTMPVRVNF